MNIFFIEQENLLAFLKQDHNDAIACVTDLSRECISHDGQIVVTFRLDKHTEVITDVFDTFEQTENWLDLFVKNNACLI